MFNGVILYNLELGLFLVFILELQHIGENGNIKSFKNANFHNMLTCLCNWKAYWFPCPLLLLQLLLFKVLIKCKAFALISLMFSRKGGAIKQFIICICDRKEAMGSLSQWRILRGEEIRLINFSYLGLSFIIVSARYLTFRGLYSYLLLGCCFSVFSNEVLPF